MQRWATGWDVAGGSGAKDASSDVGRMLAKRGVPTWGGADGRGRRAFAARGGVRACMLSGARVAEGSADGCGKGDAMAGCRGAKKVQLREAHADRRDGRGA